MRKDIGRSQRKETNEWVDKPAIGRSRGEDARVTRFRPSPRRLFGAKQFHARRNLKISRSGSRKGSPSLVARGMSMKAGYDSLLLVFLRTVSAPIRIARSRYRHLSTNSRRFFSTVSLLFGNHQPIADEDDLFRCHAKLFRLSSTVLAPLSSLQDRIDTFPCIFLLQTVRNNRFCPSEIWTRIGKKLFLEMLILKNLNSSKASVVALLKSGSGSIPRQRRNLSRPWKTLGEIERRYIYIYLEFAGTKLVFRDLSGGRIKIHTTKFSAQSEPMSTAPFPSKAAETS